MELKSFIGQIVISSATGRRFVIKRITSPEIGVATVEPGPSGYTEYYTYRTINGDPISTGALRFEDPALTEPFKKAYEAYSRTEEARWENYEYWMRAD
jgi:hypothetical protein